MDEGDRKQEGDGGGGEKEWGVRRLVGQMGKEWKDSVVYVRTTDAIRYCNCFETVAETYMRPMRF